MKPVFNSRKSIGDFYPVGTGRLKVVGKGDDPNLVKVAEVGDSTIDNGYWVHPKKAYSQKTATVTHQTALALARTKTETSYLLANFAVDGATTTDLMDYCLMNKVLPVDEDHPASLVNQLAQVAKWQPNVVILSVAGNNYREALQSTLIKELGYKNVLLRTTPDASKDKIVQAFKSVKENILKEYRKIIDTLIDNNKSMDRLVLMSQYYPELTQFTPYMIYTGFSHVARASGQTHSAFEAMENTMNELYREIQDYASQKDRQIVFIDATSSLNPLGGNHTLQIEPNHRGAKEIGELIAQAVAIKDKANDWVIKKNGDQIEKQKLTEDFIANYSVKKIGQFIQESRYQHVGLFFSPSSNLRTRFESAYHMLVGKQFDAQYTGLFAFGLLDASIVTFMAQYLWRVAIDDNHSQALRITAAVVATPVLLLENVVALAMLLALSLPIVGYHHLAKQFTNEDPEPEFALN